MPSATDLFSLAMTRACRSVGLNSSDLTFRDDYLPTDSLRLSTFDRWFQQPLVMPGELDRSSKKLLQNSWQTRLEVLAAYGDLELNFDPVPSAEPCLRGSMASYWKDRRLPRSYRHALRKLEKTLPLSAKEWLLQIVLLDISIAAARSDGLDSLSQEEKSELAQLIVQLYPSLDGDEPDLSEDEMERLLVLLDKAQWRDFQEGALSELATRLDALLSCPVPTEEETADLRGLLLDWQAPWGRLLVGGVDSQVYEIDWDGRLLILDLGGDDVYHVSQRGRRAGQFEYIVDLGGNDRYEAVGSFGFGATLGGVSLLYDHAGNDQYEGTGLNFGVGLLGVGLCIDHAGRDVYRCDSASMGTGLTGIGVLADGSGNDQYLGYSGVEGVGGPGGVGLLMDNSGDDLYVAGNGVKDSLPRHPQGYINFAQGFGFGLRPYCSGGIGILLDGDGRDRYLSSYFAQGSSYWFGAGVLCDRGGNDAYETLRYSQGAGIHLGLGLLLDSEGHDTYSAWGVSQGCGHDLAAGILWDSAGDDLYRGSWLYGGSGNANGYGFLVDCRGDDHYLRASVERPKEAMSFGYGNLMPDRDMDSLGFLLDLEGRDDYYQEDLNGMQRVISEVGVLVDLPQRQEGDKP